MRSILALLFLAACSQPTPQAPLVGAPSLAEMTYHCTPEGHEFIRVEYADGSVEDRNTDRACDYEAWRADVEARGPLYSRRTMNYEEWLRQREPEA